MEYWLRCENECGNCKLNIKDNRFLSILPSDIIDWAHNLLNYVDLQGNTMRGFPLDYFIACDNSAGISNYMISTQTNSNTLSRKAILHYIIADISHYMILYTRSKIYLNRTLNSRLPYFVKSDIDDFRNFGTTSNNVYMIDILLDGIRIKYE
jgi:hypothetical protein